MISILGLAHSNFVRSVALVCAQKGQPYQISWQLGGKNIGFRSDEHKALHPFVKIPVIQCGDTIVTETLAICRYLDAKYPESALQPTDIEAQAQHDAWCSMAITQIDQALIRNYMVELAFPSGVDGKPDLDKLQKNKPAALNAIAIIEQQLQGQNFICGNQLTLADLLLAPMVHYAVKLRAPLTLVTENSPLHDYVARLQNQTGAKDILL
ncbi:glutathione S-transferase [Oceanospirillum multiglobuliferum]|uniref:glutathione transferase n=1 Tax=Oceanospirillum multiglobuliferum TaxID=64969 RepID=A0A1T4SHL5_9GAMM|nr:glutathione S-transferase family protein [Oceanospirillum multiglobuliferum]OPX54246.1 hypothetical protein BTE48_15215 [Oceanospirillum multiglobuliferum]SKA27448.1 glutathione S-transferase [Oceanospirillum multiglobuliferum]